MSNAKKDVLDMINKRTKRIKDLRKKSHQTKTATEIILKFLEDVEPIYDIAKTGNEFYTMIDLASKDLDNKMRILDMGINMEVEWTNVENWKDLRVTGVRIRWSGWYQRKHGVEQDQYIDITALLLEDFDEVSETP